VRGAGEAAGTESLGVDLFDYGVVKDEFRRVGDVGKSHGGNSGSNWERQGVIAAAIVRAQARVLFRRRSMRMVGMDFPRSFAASTGMGGRLSRFAVSGMGKPRL
jgi:hypothetical protein